MNAELPRDAPDQDPTWNALLRHLGGIGPTVAAFTLLHALLVWLGYEFKESTQQLTVLWPAAGLMLAVLMLAPWRYWPMFIALQALVEFGVASVMQVPFLPGWALLFIAANSIDAVVGALVTRALVMRHDQVTTRELMKFVLGSAVGAAVSAPLGALVAVETYATADYLNQLQLWWAGNWLGALAVAPVVLAWATPSRRMFSSLRLRNVWEVPLILLALLPMTLWVFATNGGNVASLLQLPVILAAMLVATAFRLPPRWSTLCAAAVILLAAELGSRGNGPFIAADAFLRVVHLQMFLAALALITVLVSVVVAQMRITLGRLIESEGRYRSFVDLSTEAVWRVELAEPMPLALPVDARRAWLNTHAYVAECNVNFDQLEAGLAGDPVDSSRALTHRPWRREVPWTALLEEQLAQAARDNFRVDGLRFTVKGAARTRTFLTSFSGVVVDGKLHRIWGVARDISEIVDLTTRLQVEKERLKGYARQIMTAEERARRATAVDLHDGIAQSLVGMAMTLEVARDRAPPELQVLLDETRANLRQVQDRTRGMIADLSPPGLYELGLCPALQWLAVYFRGHDKLQVQLDCKLGEDSVPMELRVLIFKLVRELLRNVVKHAGVDTARVTVRGDADAVHIDVVDTGRGFEWQMDLFGERVGGFGLWSIADRISEVGGELNVDTAPGRGARFQLKFPLRRTAGSGVSAAMQRTG